MTSSSFRSTTSKLLISSATSGFSNEFEDEVKRLMEADLVLPAYENCLKCSHIFNILDARGAVSATERVHIIARVRKLLSRVALSYLESREKAGFPLLDGNREAEISDE